MTMKKTIASGVIASAVALAMAGAAHNAEAADKEKCYGVVKADDSFQSIEANSDLILK